MSIKATSDLWWKDAVFYCLDVEMFYDSDGDGCGDLAGLTERVDYLAGLGISCLWLMPFYPSPNRDDGYDITDFYAVDPALRDARRLHGADPHLPRPRHPRDRRLRHEPHVRPAPVVPGRALAARTRRTATSTSGRDEQPAEKPGDVVFPDQETSNWAYDRKAGQYYLHKFYSHQPDLNLANPEVRDELAQVMGFWLQQGLSGFRVDAVPFLIEGALDDPHQILRDLRAYVNRRNGEAILLGEVNLTPPEVREFLGDEDGDELHMVLDFIGNQALYLALARGSAEPLARALRDFPAIPPTASLGRFVRNHDELTLDKLTEDEREEVFARFGPDPRTCSSTAAACAAGCRRCSTATSARSGWSTRSRSRCPARRCCSTARRSAWPRTSRSRAATPSARRCSGRRDGGFSTADRAAGGRWSRARSGPSGSTSPPSAATRTRC